MEGRKEKERRKERPPRVRVRVRVNIILSNFSTDNIIVIPGDATAFPIGGSCDIVRATSYKVNLSPASGVTLISYNNNKYIANQYQGVTLIKTGSNTWYALGAVSAS